MVEPQRTRDRLSAGRRYIWLACLAGCSPQADSLEDSHNDQRDQQDAISSCDARYGTVEGYALCDQAPGECTFNAELGQDHSCRDVCADRGGQCIQAFGNATSNVCGALAEIPCDTVGHLDDLCVCSDEPTDPEPEPLSCNERYGATEGFALCAEAPDQCTFNANLAPGQSCDDVCAHGGGECLQAFGNATSNVCSALAEIPCNTAGHVDDLCVCSNDGWTPPPPPPPPGDGSETPEALGLSLFFRSGFEEGTTLPAPYTQGPQWWQRLQGEDTSTGFDWDELPGNPRFQFLVSSNKDIEDYSNNRIETVTGPFGEPTRALYMEQRLDDPDYDFNSRNQLVWGNEDGLGEEAYFSYWVKLQGDLNEMPAKCGESASWRLVGEWFTASDRIGYEIRDIGGTPHWHLKHQLKTNNGWQNNLFSESNHDVDVPIGEWFFLEVYLRHRSSADGRVLIKVDGETVFDQNGPNRTGGGVTSFFVPKLYDGYRNACVRYQWVDDFQIWR